MAREMLMVPTTDYNNLVNYYKGRLTESALLNKAGRLAAERHVTLNSPHLNKSVAVAMSKQGEREIHKLTKRLRTGGVSSRGGVQGGTDDGDDDDDDDDDLLKSPLESKLDKILRNTRKQRRPAVNKANSVTEKTLPKKAPKKSKIPTLLDVQKPSLKKPKPSGGWKKALKKGAIKGVAKQWGLSLSEGDKSKTPVKKKTTPRAVKALRPAPGWEDFTEGYKAKRYPLSDDYGASSESTADYDDYYTDEE